MQSAMRPMMFAAVAVWVLSAVLIAVLWRMRVPASIRRQFKRTAIALTAFVLAMFAWQAYRISVGITLPGWFYVWLYVGIFAPLQIALYFGAIDRESIRTE